MSVYRSAQGKMVDMGKLFAKNEKVRAVGNMNVNARGDTIDSQGRVIKPVNEKVGSNYAKTVGNKSAQSGRLNTIRPSTQPAPVPQPAQPIVQEELTEAERELEDSFDDDLEVEQIKANEMKETKPKTGKK